MRQSQTMAPADPLAAVTHPDAYHYYAALVSERPFAYDADLGLWIAAGATAVEEVLACEALGVRPPGEPVPPHLTGTSTGDVFARLIRMNDGPYHRETRPAVETALSAVDGAAVAAIARDLAADLLADLKPPNLPERIDRLIYALPVGVVARLLGIGAEDREAVEREVRTFVDGIKPGSKPMDDGTTTSLLHRLAQASGSLNVAIADRLEPPVAHASALGLLMQSYEATAGLIGNTLVAARREAAAGRAATVDAPFVREVARHDPPVQNTRRFALEDCRVCGHDLRRGDAVLVILAAANRDPTANPEPDHFQPDRAAPRNYTFGSAGHRCPGEEIAVAIAVEAAALRRAGVDWTMLPEPAGYTASTNARIPRFSA